MSRRADRLFQIVQVLRGRRLTTAALLAQRLGVSERTVYRDIQALSLSGVPVEGEAGIGYRLRADFDVPPLMFSALEVEAMVAGLRLLKAWGGGALAAAADPALEKLVAALPPARRIAAQQSRIFAPEFVNPAHVRDTFDVVHAALGEQRLLELDYSDAQQRITERVVQPLGLFFWGNAWLLAAWCTARTDYRSFRLDRCRAIRMLEARFHETPERSLNGFLRAVQASGG
ncbi:DNA-binding transcriptional regulator [Cupriavidus sp. USMAA2-4]|uniref:DNA-binding transcriptional regulator n=1 Tax=Cupriavidus malaysiensis TaxID=367825 RepID=A0ABM6F7L3_9BURK|nr:MULTISPECIES: YafY family protein [Cupriavidus]AOY92793.1 DNA-binding transcriptional regulator [Cupriavidus sp. USMAA2-4]AOZ00738.1 DNA-binding transcriptional regulator [Cupriavidus sp. USMAHM13]AOZ07495.1 DNA-binding transcriptional regulator [Cupriavidus malaysiensis]